MCSISSGLADRQVFVHQTSSSEDSLGEIPAGCPEVGLWEWSMDDSVAHFPSFLLVVPCPIGSIGAVILPQPVDIRIVFYLQERFLPLWPWTVFSSACVVLISNVSRGIVDGSYRGAIEGPFYLSGGSYGEALLLKLVFQERYRCTQHRARGCKDYPVPPPVRWYVAKL